MRVLVTVMPAPAHLHTVVPLAWALLAAGHEVRVAAHPEVADAVVTAGLTPVVLGEPADLAGVMREARTDERLERVTALLDIEDANLRNAVRFFMLAAFAMHYPDGPPGRFTEDLVAHARSWRPDLVLWDPLSFPGPLAARAAGVPHVRVLHGLDYFGHIQTRAAELGLPESPLAPMMRPTLARFGLTFEEELLIGETTLDLIPPRMQLPLGLGAQPVRRVPWTGSQPVPDWLRAEPARPRVCLTLGMSTRRFLADKAAALVSGLLEAVGGLDVEVVATLNQAQMAAVDRVPGNVRLVDYLPLSQLMPTCSAVIHHGGGGTFAAAVAHRVPQLVPAPGEGGDRKAFARYVVDRGAGLSPGPDVSVAGLRERLARVLTEPSFARGAADLHAEMLATPTPHELVPLLEKIGAGG